MEPLGVTGRRDACPTTWHPPQAGPGDGRRRRTSVAARRANLGGSQAPPVQDVRAEVDMTGGLQVRKGERLADDGFATVTVVGAADPEPLALPDERDDTDTGLGWLDDPCYEVGAFLLGLRDRG